MDVFGHHFRDFKSVEKICWACGYVIPRVSTCDEAAGFIVQHDGSEVWCGGAWHVYGSE